MWIPPNSSDQCCRETVCQAGTAFHTLTEDILLMCTVHTQKKSEKATEVSDIKSKRWFLSQGCYKLRTRAQNTLKTAIWLKKQKQKQFSFGFSAWMLFKLVSQTIQFHLWTHIFQSNLASATVPLWASTLNDIVSTVMLRTHCTLLDVN